MPTGKKDASRAGRLLQDPNTPAPTRSVAGSDLAQAPKKKGKGNKKGKKKGKEK